MAQEEFKSINSINNNNLLQSSSTFNSNTENFKEISNGRGGSQ
jgi:hypothetical protein